MGRGLHTEDSVVGNTDTVYTGSRINCIRDEMRGIQEELNGVQERMQGMESKMTTTTSSIEDLQGRVKELERPWWSRRDKNKEKSGSGERMVDFFFT